MLCKNFNFLGLMVWFGW